MINAVTVHHLTTVFARGGGGGSGGGGSGGGGGGGGGGGSGGGGGGIAVIGYIPMHFLGAWFRKAQAKHPDLFIALQVICWGITVVYMVLLVIALHGIGVLAAIGAPLGTAAGLYGLFGKVTQSKKTKAALQAAAAKDGSWDEAKLTAYGSQVFMRYQQDWTSYNTESMKTYMTPAYQYHAALMVYALQLAGRRDQVNNPVISKALITDLHDAANNDEDVVTIGFTAKANDVLVDVRDNTQLFVDNSEFTEFWRFKRSGSNWLLDGIQQATESGWTYNQPLQAFAASKGYCFSPDWGWLLLPRRGQLFSDGKFGTSDINNHVVGMYNQQLLVQVYNYMPNPASPNKNYLIAQANLPKSYGDIVVRHKKGLSLFGIRGLKEVSSEWPDFNKKYQVYATSVEQATSLELLNPKYMEQLEAVPFEVNIEVVDNVVYLYAPQKSAGTVEQYETMLGLLQNAFKEMRM